MNHERTISGATSSFRTSCRKSVCIAGCVYIPYAAIFLFMAICIFNHAWKYMGAIDTDNYFQLAHAKALLESGFIKTDPLSMHEGLSFLIPQWLTALMIYGLYLAGGTYLAGLVFHLVSIAIFVSCYKLARMHADKGSSLLVLSVFIPLYFRRIYSTRPHVISLLLLVIELILLEQYFRDRDVRHLLPLPLLSVLCINFHNSLWPMLFIVMLPFLAELFVASGFSVIKTVRKHMGMFLISMLMIASGFLNPYGLDGILYIFRSMKSIQPAIPRVMELNVSAINNRGGIAILVLFLLILLSISAGSSKKVTIRHTLLAGGMMMMAMFNNRNFNQASICLIPIVCNLLNGIDMKEEDVPKDLFTSSKMIPFIIAVAIAAASITAPVKDMSLDPWEKAVSYLDDHYTKDIRIFNTMNQGSMLEFYGYKPYIDTRLEVYGKANNEKFDYLQEYFDLQDGKIRLEDFVKKYDFDVLLLSNIEDTAIETGIPHIPYHVVFQYPYQTPSGETNIMILEKNS